MKIAIINKYQNKVYRGAETFVYELAKRLAKTNTVDIITDVNYFRLFKEKYDLIIPTNGRWQAFLVRLVTWLGGGKMVVSGQSGVGLDDRLNLYSQPDAFVALSQYQKEWANKINPLVKTIYIPNGVDMSTFKGSPLKGKKDGLRVVLSVGAFTKEKRHDLTIRAVAALTDIKLIIVGSGGDIQNEIYDLGIKSLGKERFEVLSVNRKDMPGLYKSANLLVFPTVPWESFGIVLVEAMATGLPVVATNDPIRREIVGNAGILIDPTNTSEYAAAIQKALNIKWGSIPRNQAEKFSWDTISKQYERLINTI
jgi:glycosyltransferase involved in cell wall biosynthesis